MRILKQTITAVGALALLVTNTSPAMAKTTTDDPCQCLVNNICKYQTITAMYKCTCYFTCTVTNWPGTYNYTTTGLGDDEASATKACELNLDDTNPTINYSVCTFEGP